MADTEKTPGVITPPDETAAKKARRQTVPTHTGFEDMDISDEVLRAISRMGFTETTAIQKQTIPLIMQGNDIIGIAPTGTGKTCAFGIPMLE